MATDSGLPAEVIALLNRALPSMVHIEVLLLLQRTAPKAWTPTEAAIELRSSPELARTALADLRTARLAEQLGGGQTYRLDASDDAVVASVLGLQTVYDTRPVTLIKALYKRPAASVQAFADAFRLRSEDR
jgi:hypothetical protein